VCNFKRGTDRNITDRIHCRLLEGLDETGKQARNDDQQRDGKSDGGNTQEDDFPLMQISQPQKEFQHDIASTSLPIIRLMY